MFIICFPVDAAKSFLPKSFKASFVQIYKSALRGKEKRRKGKIEYKYPSKLRFEMRFPDTDIVGNSV